ncbi:MAG: transglutaminase domain-containing protein [Chloroflexi bacterium]|nr:transglutaminase domain-containing protein [Chloroflexota bacterium]
MAVLATPRTTSKPRRLLPSLGELVGLALLALPLLVTFTTIESARWVKGMPSLPLQIALSLTLGMLLLRLNISWRITYPIGLAAGFMVALGLGLWQLSGSPAMGMGIFLIVALWWTTHTTLWLAYRGPSSILAISVSLGVLVIALGFLSSTFYPRLLLYLLAAAPALAYFHQQPGSGAGSWTPRVGSMILAVLLMAATLAIAWPAPSPEHPIRPTAASKLEETWYRLLERATLFDSAPNRQDWLRFNLHPDLPFTGPISPSNEVVMFVKSSEPHKWRVSVYEKYTPRGWTRVPELPSEELIDVVPQPPQSDNLQREEFEIEVRTLSLTRNMAVAGEPVSASIPSLVKFSPTARFTLDIEGPQSTYLPPAILSDRDLLLQHQNAAQEDGSSTPETHGLKVEELQTGDTVLTVERIEEGPAPPLFLSSVSRLTPPRSYKTVGSVSTATPEMLRAAGQDYPTWVTDRYLQLPPDFPQNVRLLARELAVGMDNPHDVAESIQAHLGTLPYSTDIVGPPVDRDGVDWFLNDQGVGYCQYYASAMITMLRSLGIPARLVVGFTPGDWDSQRGIWVVRAKHYHAWPEVYFPDYGWVEYEPTPAGVQPNLEELGFEQPLTSTGGAFATDDEDCIDPFEECEFDDPGLTGDLSDSGANPESAAASRGASSLLPRIGAVAGVLILVALVIMYLLRLRRSRLGLAVSAYTSMGFLASLAGAPRQPQNTPQEFGARVAALLPGLDDDIDTVIEAYEINCYSRAKGLDIFHEWRVAASWRVVRRALLKRIIRRLRSRLSIHRRKASPVLQP